MYCNSVNINIDLLPMYKVGKCMAWKISIWEMLVCEMMIWEISVWEMYDMGILEIMVWGSVWGTLINGYY